LPLLDDEISALLEAVYAQLVKKLTVGHLCAGRANNAEKTDAKHPVGLLRVCGSCQ